MTRVTKTTKKETKTVTVEVKIPKVVIELSTQEANDLYKALAKQTNLFDLYMELGVVLNGGFDA